jgi:hypothetical protein
MVQLPPAVKDLVLAISYRIGASKKPGIEA